MLFARGCGSWQLPYAAATDALSPRERLDLEAHAAGCAECTDALRHAARIDVALRRAYAPLRERRAQLAPGRARFALGPRSGSSSAWLPAPALFARLAELSVALSVSLFALSGSLGSTDQTQAHPLPELAPEEWRSQADVIEIREFERLRVNQQTSPAVVIRLPAGGRFEFDPVEIVKLTISITPR
jgi:anti-sigma factor RsiW